MTTPPEGWHRAVERYASRLRDANILPEQVQQIEWVAHSERFMGRAWAYIGGVVDLEPEKAGRILVGHYVTITHAAGQLHFYEPYKPSPS